MNGVNHAHDGAVTWLAAGVGKGHDQPTLVYGFAINHLMEIAFQ